MTKQKKKQESAPVKIAREAIEAYICEGKIIEPPKDTPGDLLNRQAGVFVSLKIGNMLRGCIGTMYPTQPNIALEIIRNAIQSATWDPRFPPVQPPELSSLVYSVDIMEEPEEVPDESHLDPKEYGVIVESGPCVGVLLPDLDGVDTVEQQVDIARKKAGIAPGKSLKLYRFKVTRHR